MKKIHLARLNLGIAALLLVLVGGLVGYGLGDFRARQNSFPEIKPVPDINPGVPTVELREVKDGALKGQIGEKKVRLIWSADGILDAEPYETFSIPLKEIRLNEFMTIHTIPENALYVASREGKYYYSVFDKRSLSITPKNRLYFGSEKEAEAAGYSKK